MIFTMRFYRHCDLDMIHVLWSLPARKRTAIVKQCIYAYLGQSELSLADYDFEPNYIRAEDLHEVYSLALRLNDDDPTTVFVRDTLKEGYKNNALKNIVRMYLGSYGISAYAKDESSWQELRNLEGTISVQTVPLTVQQNEPEPQTVEEPIQMEVSTPIEETCETEIEPTVVSIPLETVRRQPTQPIRRTVVAHEEETTEP